MMHVLTPGNRMIVKGQRDGRDSYALIECSESGLSAVFAERLEDLE